MKESNLFKRLVATFVVIFLNSPAVVLAEAPSYIEDVKATVSYADLNLDSEEDVRMLYQRLQYASKAACDIASPKITESIIMKPSRRRAIRQCYRESLFNAIDKFDNEDLTRVHAG